MLAASLKKASHQGVLLKCQLTKKVPAMTNEEDCPMLDRDMTLLIEHSDGAMANAFTSIMNPTMRIERGVGSEQAMFLAIAEMYCRGVSTREVPVMAEKLCRLTVNSPKVSRAAAELEEECEAWRSYPMGEIAYLILDTR
jgi:hypothetical protein